MVAITGANGLLGSFIVRKLLTENQSVIAIKRTESDISLLRDVADKISWRDADITDQVSLNEAMQGANLVIHAAALVSFNPRDSKKVFEVNVQGTINVIEACLSNKVQRLLHISSVAALGRQKDQQIVDEENKWVSSTLNSAYAESKYLAELEIFRAQEEGLSTIMVNPSVILAPADWNRSSAQLFKYVWEQKSFYIEGVLNYVDVRDVANIVYQLLFLPDKCGRFIVSAGRISFIDFFTSIARNFNRIPPHIKLNRKFLKTPGLVGNIALIYYTL